MILTDHERGITSLVVLLDGSLASGSRDGTIRIWNLSNGKTIKILKIPSIPNIQFQIWPSILLAVLPNGLLASSGDWDGNGRIRIWDVNSGQVLKILTGHSMGVSSLLVSPDGLLVSGSYQEIRIWNVNSGQTLKVLTGHTSYVKVAFLPDGHLASISQDSDDLTIRIWNITNGQTLKVLYHYNGLVKSLAVLKDGSIVTGSSIGRISISNISNPNTVSQFYAHNKEITSLLVLPDGSLISGSSDYTIYIRDPFMKIKKILTQKYEGVTCLVNLPDGSLASGGGGGVAYAGAIYVWNL